MINFDFHFHLLTKHAISKQADLNKPIEVDGFVMKALNEMIGGSFESQASPAQVLDSQLYFGINAINAVELAFVQDIHKLLGIINIEEGLPLNREMVRQIKEGLTSYYNLFNEQVAFTLSALTNNAGWKIHLIKRGDEAARKAIEAALSDPENFAQAKNRWFALSIEGGHNLVETLINSGQRHMTAELTLKRIQDREDVDIISMNLCHLTDIPELRLGGFAQGLNRKAHGLFRSDDFIPFGGKLKGTTVGLQAEL